MENNESKLEKQLSSMFEATLEQKAVDMAEKVWFEKYSKPLLADEEGIEKIKSCIRLATRPYAGMSYMDEDKVLGDIDEILREHCIASFGDILKQMFEEGENYERLRKISREVVNQIFKGFEDEKEN